MVTEEQVNEILNADGEQSDKVKNILSTFQEDFNSQLNALKATNVALKQEKTEEVAKKQAITKERDELKEVNAKLEQQVKDLAPDEVQKVFDQKLQEIQIGHAAKVSELEKTIEEQKTKIEAGEKAQLKNECMTEFNKAIADMKIASDCIDPFAEYVLGNDCAKFARRPIGNGEFILATKDGMSIKQAVEAARNSTFGKNCILNSSSGGGAEGGARRTDPKDNPFITGNVTEQMKLFRENKTEYDRLKAAAGK